MNHTIKAYISTIVREVVENELVTADLVPSRRRLVVANWKMNMNLASTRKFVKDLVVTKEQCTVVICPPYPLIYPLNELVNENKSSITIGAQNLHRQDKGAFTGEVSADLLKELDCEFAIIGHSEVRASGETDEVINQKVKKALATGIDPIICVGETMEQREQAQTNEVVTGQLLQALTDVSDLSRVVLAYEPIWAIGTGLSATPDQAQEVHQQIRATLLKTFGQVAEQIPILYGGSVNQDNAASLAEMGEIDGALVGGASLDGTGFSTIVHAFD
ncbi:triose-phosphate isomerase [Aquibacillus halophilus]|uniref:Triosephosphate isomerase n=1 Tax=Aquibacillus halophilus TaxID=930132 RepID=A0A6A8DD02_9BACI|nr:triose-phosphate isomerase [Aquibacillus halophilus]MRH41661.1 triose-phosphate isomerase [Aquibacillus halophilus]